MGLDSKCLSYQGQLVCYKPGYGWGWSQIEKADEFVPFDYAQVEQAGSFHIRVHRFFSFQGQLRGFVGRVEQAGHRFDGLFAVVVQMIVGEFDFTDRLCHRWDIELGSSEPAGEEWPQIHGGARISGYGMAASSAEVLAAEEARWRRR